VAYGDRTKPSGIEAWLEEHSPGYQYGWVLLLLGLTFIVMPPGRPTPGSGSSPSSSRA